ncbi:MAG: type VI secretion system baseplate subunit TssE [Desulfatitalea sp.]|nr:type VI secretion system baseplate subunit TssE [Desulfatitalea sp.]
MAANRQQLQMSVFDRLDQNVNEAILGGAIADMDVVRAAVLRDVENLLNTRRTIEPPAEGFPHLERSLYTYGIDDFVAQNPKSGQVQKLLEATILETISRFEPRLKEVQVRLLPVDDYQPHLCFTVRATLIAEPLREPILFNTWFSAGRGEYKVDAHSKGGR